MINIISCNNSISLLRHNPLILLCRLILVIFIGHFLQQTCCFPSVSETDRATHHCIPFRGLFLRDQYAERGECWYTVCVSRNEMQTAAQCCRVVHCSGKNKTDKCVWTTEHNCAVLVTLPRKAEFLRWPGRWVAHKKKGSGSICT